MKKLDVLKRSVVGVCAATLLTGLCAVPAFAVGEVDASNVGVTEVTAQVSSQLSVTVPTALTASVEDDGTLAYANTVAIKNKSQLNPVHVSGLSIESIDGKLVAKTGFDGNSVDKNVAWTDVKPGTALASQDLMAAFSSSTDWTVDAATGSSEAEYGSLPLAFSGKMKNLSATGDISLYKIKWTVAFGAYSVS